jgi:hypothetical protein
MDEFLALEPVIVNGETVYVNRFGELWRWKRHRMWTSPKFMRIVTKPDHIGYIYPRINGKNIYLHRIISATFLGLDMNDSKIQVDHINGIRHDNRLVNLRLVTPQQNQWNHTKAKGYTWNKRDHKWYAQIRIDGKTQYLGSFDNEEEAHAAYLEAKSRVHII